MNVIESMGSKNRVGARDTDLNRNEPPSIATRPRQGGVIRTTHSNSWVARYGPWAVVTGASSGLGKEFSIQIAERGLNLVLTARRREQLQMVATQCEARGVEVLVVPLDIRDPQAPHRLREAAGDKQIGLLVNNAGFGLMGNVVDLDLQAQIDMILVNSVAPLAMTYALLPEMLAKGSGGIITVSSIAGFHGNPLMTTYGSTKAFALCFSEGLASEVRVRGVDVLTVCPGITRTAFIESAGMSVPKGFSALDPRRVVTEALAGLGRRRMVITGLDNRVFVHLHRIMPRSLISRIKLVFANKFKASKVEMPAVPGA